MTLCFWYRNGISSSCRILGTVKPLMRNGPVMGGFEWARTDTSRTLIGVKAGKCTITSEAFLQSLEKKTSSHMDLQDRIGKLDNSFAYDEDAGFSLRRLSKDELDDRVQKYAHEMAILKKSEDEIAHFVVESWKANKSLRTTDLLGRMDSFSLGRKVLMDMCQREVADWIESGKATDQSVKFLLLSVIHGGKYQDYVPKGLWQFLQHTQDGKTWGWIPIFLGVILKTINKRYDFGENKLFKENFSRLVHLWDDQITNDFGIDSKSQEKALFIAVLHIRLMTADFHRLIYLVPETEWSDFSLLLESSAYSVNKPFEFIYPNEDGVFLPIGSRNIPLKIDQSGTPVHRIALFYATDRFIDDAHGAFQERFGKGFDAVVAHWDTDGELKNVIAFDTQVHRPSGDGGAYAEVTRRVLISALRDDNDYDDFDKEADDSLDWTIPSKAELSDFLGSSVLLLKEEAHRFGGHPHRSFEPPDYYDI